MVIDLKKKFLMCERERDGDLLCFDYDPQEEKELGEDSAAHVRSAACYFGFHDRGVLNSEVRGWILRVYKFYKYEEDSVIERERDRDFVLYNISCTYPKARSVRSQAMTAAAWEAARLSVRHRVRWWAPARTEANPTTEAISANNRKYPVAPLPSLQQQPKPSQSH
jgi:hypothetical protein